MQHCTVYIFYIIMDPIMSLVGSIEPTWCVFMVTMVTCSNEKPPPKSKDLTNIREGGNPGWSTCLYCRKHKLISKIQLFCVYVCLSCLSLEKGTKAQRHPQSFSLQSLGPNCVNYFFLMLILTHGFLINCSVRSYRVSF